jgi:hypothetical protein
LVFTFLPREHGWGTAGIVNPVSVFGTFLVVTNLITDFLSFCGDILFNVNYLLGFLHHVAVSCVAEVFEEHSTSII